MAIREDLVASAISFLQDPSVSASPLENRVAFLQSKNLTQEEIDAALGRAGGSSAPPSYPSYAPPQQQVARQPQPGYGGYQQYPWQQPPPELPKRDWRDWFIMATVVGGVGYGAYFMAKRYIYPMIAPPTPPQLEQDKQAIDESFEKAFSLLDQLAKDTESLKTSEQERTERLDVALTEVETVISELKNASRRREEESRRIGDEVRGLKDLIPRAIDGQKESTDKRLKELNTEMKSLKTLMGQRLNLSATTSPYNRIQTPAAPSTPSPSTTTTNGDTTNETIPARPAAVSTSSATDAVSSIQGRSSTPFSTGLPAGGAKIPAWQMAAANKSTPSVNTTATVTSPSQEASSSS